MINNKYDKNVWDQLQLHLLASSQFLQILELHTSGKLEIILNENLNLNLFGWTFIV